MRAVYTITVFLGALLLFAVQPLMGKLLLPRLGGTPAVWNTCMVFFQVALLAGYAYAHLLTKLRSLRWQVVLHGAVLTAGIIALPIGLREGAAPPTADSPIPWLVAVLALSVGLPFFAVSTNAPLLQRWPVSLDPSTSSRIDSTLVGADNSGGWSPWRSERRTAGDPGRPTFGYAPREIRFWDAS